MIKKQVIVLSIATVMTLTSTALFADTLALQSQNEPHAIQISCNGIDTTLPVPKSGDGSREVPYSLLDLLFGQQFQCTFTEADTNILIGTAGFHIFAGDSTALVTYDPAQIHAGYTVQLNPITATIMPTENITVILRRN